ncbi:lysophospholipid acyltransferase family protein [Anianabacter salinae]|uniref:lysophospholipid acyltransferase family protein n=1 Tax=Anianabacter salinae TaxID=2851023 RepID=UPI00225E02E5|nr:lysophospholipid acyltransferase family protein [Anianabacter salinae]MBV0911958.1 1-acyl-sn-glycerol-3-phosphate acyltransferase [Anianabacter salinae]
MTTWHSDTAPPEPRVPVAGKLRAIVRGTVLGAVIFGLFAVQMLLRLIERPLFGLHRPWTPWITVAAARAAFAVLGIKHSITGRMMTEPGALVANHCGWLDIFSLNAAGPLYFVSKSEVAGWPGIGLLARGVGTVFITRDPRHSGHQRQVFEDRLKAGHKLLFFPEGTSTDGRRVLDFKSTLFAAFFADDLRELLSVQPVSVIYHPPEGADPRFYGWWGDMSFGAHLVKTLAARRQGSVEIVFHDPLKVAEAQDRKALARACELAVRGGVEDRLPLGAEASAHRRDKAL